MGERFMKGQTYVITAIIVTIIIAVFAVTNVSMVEVNYLFWKVESPLILVILFSVLMGGIIAAAVSIIKIYRLEKDSKKLRNEIEQLHHVMQKHGVKIPKPSKTDGNEADAKSKR